MEYDSRTNNTIQKNIKMAKFYDSNANINDVDYRPERNIDRGTIAVSYTHLDVYKRQQVIRINDVNELNVDDLYEARRIAITSGASTPTYLTNQVIEYLENYPCQKPEIKIQDIL